MIFAQTKTFGDMYNVRLQPTEGLTSVGRRLRAYRQLSFAEKAFFDQYLQEYSECSDVIILQA